MELETIRFGLRVGDAMKPSFDQLYETAIAEWPERLDLAVTDKGPVYVVEGLAPLQERIAAKWAGKPSGVLMRNLHWAISAVANRAFEWREPVDVRSLSREAIRDKFEADLQIILDRPRNISGADVAQIKSYFGR